MTEVGMFSNKPYLVKAFYQWIVDNKCTPYFMVDAEKEGVNVPTEFVQNGQIVLNLQPDAIRDLYLGMRKVTFRATFGGEEWEIYLPMGAIKAVYAMENGEGMMFDSFEDDDDFPPEPNDGGDKPSHLRIVD